MSFDEIKQTVRVDSNHKIILSVPEYAEGMQVEVTVQPVAPAVNRKPGSAVGMFKIEPGFDEPLAEFGDYNTASAD